MNVIELQKTLTALGHHVEEDGEAGPETWQALLAEIGRDLPGLGAALADEFALTEIETPLRVCHFLAQAAHETGGFSSLARQGGPDLFARYDNRIDLGNVEKGDGYRYRGRGLLPLTGRANYLAYGARLELDLIAHPDQVAEPQTAAAVSCLYWQYKGLNEVADRDDCPAITLRIAGSREGLANREAYLAKIKRLWGLA